MNNLPLANIVTLGVRDFATQRSFYQRLGWPMVFDSDEFAVFELRGLLLALFPVEQLAKDAQVAPCVSQGGILFSIIVNAEKLEDVDAMVRAFQDAGGKVSKEPTDAEFFDGRSAYVADPEGNYWEIAWAAPGNAVVEAARRAAGLTMAQ
jgi:predicted lactoylglutathione lyase